MAAGTAQIRFAGDSIVFDTNFAGEVREMLRAGSFLDAPREVMMLHGTLGALGMDSQVSEALHQWCSTGVACATWVSGLSAVVARPGDGSFAPLYVTDMPK